MATKLDKDIIRESTIIINDREIIVTLTSNQEISLKLKGMKSGEVKIPILQLFKQLTGDVSEEDKPKKKPVSYEHEDKKGSKKNPMISLYDLRSQSAIASLDYPTRAKFDGIIKNLIDEYLS